MKYFHSPRYVVLAGVFLLLVAFVVAQAGGNLPSFFGHSPGEIENEFVTVEEACDDPTNPANHYKYCEALCPPGYYAVSGSCSTIFTAPMESGIQNNFSGTLPNLRGWSCFNGGLADYTIPPFPVDEYVKATVVCARAGTAIVTPAENVVCGDYRIEGSEVCDKTNFGNWLDCSDFSTGGPNPQTLCNGQLKCNDSSNACGGFDISQCVYCNGNNNPCNPPFTLCLDNTCQTSCSSHGGSNPVGVVVGDDCPLGQSCSGVPDTYIYGGFCGDDVLQVANGELCDQSCAGYPTFGIVCPDGTSVSSGQVCKDCACEPDPAPCCKDGFGIPQCITNEDCGVVTSEYGTITGTCNMGCCAYP